LAGGGAGRRLAPPTVCRAEVDDHIDTCRASGSGGQPVNKTDSAVCITHLPTGIAVAVQQERSQHLSAKAIQMLKARLYELELQKREAERLAAEASKTDIGWGHQIRSYVLQPYQMVKDLCGRGWSGQIRRRCSTGTSTSSWRRRSPRGWARARIRKRLRRAGADAR
jgi:protein subunit release factor B